MFKALIINFLRAISQSSFSQSFYKCIKVELWLYLLKKKTNLTCKMEPSCIWYVGLRYPQPIQLIIPTNLPSESLIRKILEIFQKHPKSLPN